MTKKKVIRAVRVGAAHGARPSMPSMHRNDPARRTAAVAAVPLFTSSSFLAVLPSCSVTTNPCKCSRERSGGAGGAGGTGGAGGGSPVHRTCAPSALSVPGQG